MKKKILLVDDKATIGKVASIYLGKEGLRCYVFGKSY